MRFTKNAPYLRFLKLLESIGTFSIIDPLELIIICKLFVHWSNNEQVLVGDFMKFNKIASPATLHRKLYHLIDLKIVKLKSSPNDARLKFIIPTSKLEKDINKLNLIFKKIVL